MSANHDHLDELAQQDRFATLRGKKYWRTLDELAGSSEFDNYVTREFQENADEWQGGDVSRRSFIKLMGASMALAGVYGCMKQPAGKMVPYVVPPEYNTAGKPLFYATAFPFGGYAKGVLAEQHLGRPTKLEGNPEHPQSLGASDVFTQAAVLSLYDPDRAQNTTTLGQMASFSAYQRAVAARFAGKPGGQGVAILTETVTSPTLVAQLGTLMEKYPDIKWYQWEPVGRDNARAGAVAAFAKDVQTIYHFDKAKRILSLDSNFLLDDPFSVRYAREFSDARKVRFDEGAHINKGADAMPRLYVAESTPTIVGSMADHSKHRKRLKPSEIAGLAGAIARAIVGTPDTGTHAEFVNAVAADLLAHNGSSLVVVGETQPPAVHALAHALNASLGAVGNTVTYIDPVEAQSQDNVASLKTLVSAIDKSEIDTLLILGGNPVYSAPADFDFGTRLVNFSNVKNADGSFKNFSSHLSSHYDETAFRCQWHVPESHFLESWSDIRAWDGTATIIQPIIAPLYNSHTPHDIVTTLLETPDAPAQDLVKNHWKGSQQGVEFENWWRTTLEKGVVEGSTFAAVTPVLNLELAGAIAALPAPVSAAAGTLEIVVRPDPTIYDGRFANNAWLQECPKPISKVTWDNPAFISRKTAEELGLSTGSVLTVANGKFATDFAVQVIPNHPDGSLSVTLGYGRERGGHIAEGSSDGTKSGGFNANRIVTSDKRHIVTGVTTMLSRHSYKLAITQASQNIEGKDLEGRDIVRIESVDGLEHRHKHVYLPLYNQTEDWQKNIGVHKWGAVVDNNACIGCNACVVACQAENNTPVVGKHQIERFNRQMHWMRIDQYYFPAEEEHVKADPSQFGEGPYYEPMFCQHCELAPCEVVCPVVATSHSVEGLNEMTYNRCIGTRYCSNNCPYKVRRFNFLNWNIRTEPHQLVYNPDVTVRQRGVMEKCTFCVQRLVHTRQDVKKLKVQIDAAKDDVTKQSLGDEYHKIMSELQTACQQACPTEAIHFADLNYRDKDGKLPEAEVLKTGDNPAHFAVIEDVGTKPRTTYLARFNNPNREMAPAKAHDTHGPDKAHGDSHETAIETEHEAAH